MKIVTALVCLTASLVHATNSTWPYQTFKTQPSFQPPVLDITRNGTTAPGYIFFAPAGKAHQTAPLIMTDDGELVWHGANYNTGFNFGVQTYRGEQVLVYQNGTVYAEPVGRGYGFVVLLDKTYSLIANVTLAGNFVTSEGPRYATNIDLHEVFVTNRGTVLVTANNVTQTDLTSVGGPADGWVVDGQIYEIDIATDEVLFSWSALNHTEAIPFTDSVYPLGSEGFNAQNQSAAWGYFHVNAVAPFNDGYIISSRYTCSEIVIDRSGNVVWRLSGRYGADFTLGPNTNFCFQHDIRPVYPDPATYTVPTNLTIHLHDNANCPIDNGTTPTSGLRLNVDQENRVVTLSERFENPLDPLYATAQGSFQPLPDGHVFLGHGYIPYMQEFAADGAILATYQFGSGPATISYRAFKQMWVGCPEVPPAVYVDTTVNNAENMTVYMSWNGATEYDTWIVRGGDRYMDIVASVPKTGFETAVSFPRTVKIQVEAVMSDGRSNGCRHTGWRNTSPTMTVDY